MRDVSTGGVDQDSAYKSEGTINTRYIPNLGSLSNAYKKKVISKSNNKGVKLGYGKGSKTGNNLNKIRQFKKNPSSKGRSKHQRRGIKITMMKEMIRPNLKMLVTNLEGRSLRISLQKIDYWTSSTTFHGVLSHMLCR